MSAIENDILEKFRQLDEVSKLRLLATLERETHPPALTLEESIERATALREKLRAKYGDHHFNIQAVLDEIREEASWPRWS